MTEIQVFERVKLAVTRRKAVMVCKRQTLTTRKQYALVLHYFFLEPNSSYESIGRHDLVKSGPVTIDVQYWYLPWFVAEIKIPQRSSIQKGCF